MSAILSKHFAAAVLAGTALLLAGALGGCALRQPQAPVTRGPAMIAPENHPLVKTYNDAMVLTTQLQYDPAAVKFQSVINPLDEMGDYDRAAEGMFWLGYCREKQGMTDVAIRLYQRLTDVYPQTPPARRAVQRLIELNKPPDTSRPRPTTQPST